MNPERLPVEIMESAAKSPENELRIVQSLGSTAAEKAVSRSQLKRNQDRADDIAFKIILEHVTPGENGEQCFNLSEYFYHEEHDSSAKNKFKDRVAKALCAQCPVRQSCLEGAIERDERYGIWGGVKAEHLKALRNPETN